MNVRIVLGILLVAHGCLSNLLEAFMQMVLPVYHFIPSGAVNTLACVQVQSLQVLGQAGPEAAATHRLLGKRFVPTCKSLVRKLVMGWPASA